MTKPQQPPSNDKNDALDRVAGYVALVWTIQQRLQETLGIHTVADLERYLYDLDQPDR